MSLAEEPGTRDKRRVAPRKSNVRLLCLLALLQLGVGPLVIVTLSFVGHVAKPVMQAMAKPDHNEVRERCDLAVQHWLDGVTQFTWSDTSAPVSNDTANSKAKAESTKLWAWCVVTAPSAPCVDLKNDLPGWNLGRWTPTGLGAPPGPPPRIG